MRSVQPNRAPDLQRTLELESHMKPNARKTLIPMLLAAIIATPGLAMAQASPAKPAAPPTGERTVRTMFAWADRNKDGQLTRAEANNALPITHQKFAEIDTGKRGWISFDQFSAFTTKRVGKQADDILKTGDW
jgi:hypothetical protein